ncbi:hypothetical protein [Rubinisphaera margarita]|uniref:hypothetical protein n=1 Tax=Rubinisphaera margarita TaxID=2909586 RepID=UPI001EE7F480|nr:hypothetical protein [Rubinisphaera margarita]MCG6157109.1 hypothetical protein [Rubinisphaera margarita]
MSSQWWEEVSGEDLCQGDLLPKCLVPIYGAGDLSIGENGTGEGDVELIESDLIVVTQSCDLANKKVEFVALCPVNSIQELEDAGTLQRRGAWEEVRKGRVAGRHLLSSPVHPANNRECLVVDFGHIVSLPVDHLSSKAAGMTARWRLKSPFLEHFSQSLARFFMRVGLPSDIEPFK